MKSVLIDSQVQSKMDVKPLLQMCTLFRQQKLSAVELPIEGMGHFSLSSNIFVRVLSKQGESCDRKRLYATDKVGVFKVFPSKLPQNFQDTGL